jgi:hypothetical protein
MKVIGFRHAVGMFFWRLRPRLPEAIFSICRDEGAPDFSDADVSVLRRIRGTSTPRCRGCARWRRNA